MEVILRDERGRIVIRLHIWNLIAAYLDECRKAPDIKKCSLEVNGEKIEKPAFWKD